MTGEFLWADVLCCSPANPCGGSSFLGGTLPKTKGLNQCLVYISVYEPNMADIGHTNEYQ